MSQMAYRVFARPIFHTLFEIDEWPKHLLHPIVLWRFSPPHLLPCSVEPKGEGGGGGGGRGPSALSLCMTATYIA